MLEIIEIGAHLQVFQHCHARENPAAFGRLGDALAGDEMRWQMGNVLTVEDHLTGARLRAAADGHHQRRLAGAVGADQADDLALVDLDIDTGQSPDIAIIGFDTLDFEKRFTGHQAAPPSSSSAITSSTSSSSTPR
ncbi:hypothetical protein D3C72_898420 [compost metagenome]